jgi:MFS family permease
VIGLLTSTAALGGLFGSLMTSRVTRRLGQGPAIWMSAAAFAPTAFVAPFLHRDWTLALYAVAQIVMWGSVVVYNITQVSFRQALCPPHLLGRMNATMRFLVWGTMPLGGLLGGVLGAAIGIRPTLLVVAIGSCLTFLPVYFSPLRRMRELPGYVPDVETAGPLVESER